MFDAPTPPANLPTGKEPEDMFAKVEPDSTPRGQSTGESGLATTQLNVAPAEIKPPLIASRKLILVGGIVLGILVIVGGGYAAFRFVRQASLPAPASTEVAVPSAAVEEVPALSIPELPLPPALPEPETAPAVPAVPVDSDSDGLSDEEEDATGTVSNNPDSDNDSLLDGEEVKTYQTDPLNPDTDGDTFLDGQEVKNGYNPKGEGKLFTVPTAQP